MYNPESEVGMVKVSDDPSVPKFAEGGITDHVNGLNRATNRLETNMAEFFNRLKPILRDAEPAEVSMKAPTAPDNASGMTVELASIWQRLESMAEALTLYAERIDL